MHDSTMTCGFCVVCMYRWVALAYSLLWPSWPPFPSAES
jgi:hypothetical protein